MDSTLTPLGIIQARELGNYLKDNYKIENSINILCASELNRSQHTALELFHDILYITKDPFKNKKLIKLKNFFENYSIKRYLRKLNEMKLKNNKMIIFFLNLIDEEYKENFKKNMNDLINTYK